ncbi:MAG: hypothetical protein U0571_11290 [Candidatus Brocadia sapporoensis]
MIEHGQTEFVHATLRRRLVSASHAWKMVRRELVRRRKKSCSGDR